MAEKVVLAYSGDSLNDFNYETDAAGFTDTLGLPAHALSLLIEQTQVLQ